MKIFHNKLFALVLFRILIIWSKDYEPRLYTRIKCNSMAVYQKQNWETLHVKYVHKQ